MSSNLHGVVLADELGRNATRAAARRGLVPLLPGAYVAATQPIDSRILAAAVTATMGGQYAFCGPTALWMYGLATEPSRVGLCIPHRTRLHLGPHVDVSRVAARVLQGARVVDGRVLVRLEVAVVQAAAAAPAAEVLALVADVLRRRRTAAPRLLSTCGRGLSGSSAVRAALAQLTGASLDAGVRRLLAALQRRGVSGLETEVRFVSAAGASCYADVLHRPTMTVLELDGFDSHSELQRFRTDRRRDRWMQAEHGVLTVRIDLAEDVERVADDVLVILRRRSAA